MDNQEQLIEVLRRIEANQLKSLEVQAESVSFARQQIEWAQAASEIAQKLQREAIGRVRHVSMFVLPVIVLLIALLMYICIKWRII